MLFLSQIWEFLLSLSLSFSTCLSVFSFAFLSFYFWCTFLCNLYFCIFGVLFFVLLVYFSLYFWCTFLCSFGVLFFVLLVYFSLYFWCTFLFLPIVSLLCTVCPCFYRNEMLLVRYDGKWILPIFCFSKF